MGSFGKKGGWVRAEGLVRGDLPRLVSQLVGVIPAQFAGFTVIERFVRLARVIFVIVERFTGDKARQADKVWDSPASKELLKKLVTADDGLGRLSPSDPAVTPTRAGTTATSPTGAPAARPATGACTEAGDDRCRPRTDDHGPGHHHGGDDD